MTHLKRAGVQGAHDAAAAMTTDGGGLVRDCAALLACAMRLHLSNEAVAFWNASREFRMLLRNDPTEPGVVAFELCIMPGDEDDDEGDDRLARVLELEHDGYLDDDDGLFVLAGYSFPLEDVVRSPDMLEEARAYVNRVHAYSICKCGAYLIKDGARMCLFCQLTDDPSAPADQFCAICHDTGAARHMVTQACCGQALHRSCSATWASVSKDARCPLCRADPGNRQACAPGSNGGRRGT